VAIVIPAFNEEINLMVLLPKVMKYCNEFDIIVVNDGSIDGTAQVVERFTKTNRKIKLLSHPFNIGGGASVQTGVRFALLKGYDYVIQVDADNQHDPAEVKKLLEPLLNDEADLVIGSRFLGKTYFRTSPIRLLGIKFYSKMASILTKQKITDVTSGFKAMNRKVLSFVATNYPSRHPALEATIKMGREGLRIKEVPVHMRIRQYGQSEFSIKRFFLFPFRMIISLIKAV